MEFTPNKKKSYHYKLYGNQQAADLLGIVGVGVSDGELNCGFSAKLSETIGYLL